MREKILYIIKPILWAGIFFSILLLKPESGFSDDTNNISKTKETLRYRTKTKMVYAVPKEDSSEYEVKTCEINTVLKQIISKNTEKETHVRIDFEDFTKKWFIGDKLVETSHEKPASCEIWFDEEGNILKSKNITGEFDFKKILPKNLPEKLKIGSSWSSESEVKLPKGFPKLILKTDCTPIKFQKIKNMDCVEIATETKGGQEVKYKGIDTKIIADYNGKIVCDKITGFLVNIQTKGSLKIIGSNELILENYTEFSLEQMSN